MTSFSFLHVFYKGGEKNVKKDHSNPKTKNISYENKLENYVHKYRFNKRGQNHKRLR